MDNFGPVTAAQKGKRITDILDEVTALLSVTQSVADEIMSFVHSRHKPTAELILETVPVFGDVFDIGHDEGSTIANGVEPLEPTATENATEVVPDSVPVISEPSDETVRVSPFVVNGD